MSDNWGDAATVTVTMLDSRHGENGAVWLAGQTYTSTVGFARWLIDRKYATATIEEPTAGWEDLRFPAQGINPAGSPEPFTVNTTDGLLDSAYNKDCVCSGVAQLPHSWLRGSPIKPHVHVKFRNAAAGNTRWTLEYDIASVNGEWTETYTSDTKTLASPQNTKKHCILSFDTIAMTSFKESACVLWRITRPGQSDAADTHDYTVALVEFDIHYIRGKNGTTYELPT